MTTMEQLRAARTASKTLLRASEAQRNQALYNMADALENQREAILKENALDVEAARDDISEVMLDRLTLNEERIAAMADGVRQAAALPDPVGLTLETVTRPNGLRIEKRSVPMGVIAIVYESRPNVTSDAAALALKSGNACVLRGGREARRSARAITAALREGVVKAGLPADSVSMLEDTSHESVNELMKAVGLVDLLIPRGGGRLIDACVRDALVPCIQTGTGICHVYVDGEADQDMALDIIENAKTSRPSVCNAEEVLLVDRRIAPAFLPKLKKRLIADRQADGKPPVELRPDREAADILNLPPAGPDDFDTEFLDYILAVGLVDGAENAVEHIAAHSTGHSDAIVTANQDTAEFFLRTVDSAAVYWNASTRFTDGGEFGLGCEMGISTQKLHARGPMGLRELTTYKYVICGTGQTR